MQIPQPLPGDLYEVVAMLANAGTPGQAFATSGYSFVSPGGVTYYPIDTSVTVAADSSLSMTLTPNKFGAAGIVAVGAALSIYLNGVLQAGSFTVASCTPSPYSTYARHLARVLGTAIQAVDGSMIAEDLRALGKGLYDADNTLTRAINEAFPDTASDLLTEWETRLGLGVDTTLPVATREVNLLAKYRAAFGASPSRINTAIRSVDPYAFVTEFTIAQIRNNEPNANYWAATTFRYVFKFDVTVSSSIFNNAINKARLAAIVEQMKPAHTTYEIVMYAAGFKWSLSTWGQESWGN